MGFTHYWYRPLKIEKNVFANIAIDTRKVLNYLQKDLGIALSSGFGEADTVPEITDDLIAFNGSDEQPAGLWTTTEQLGIVWPAPNASIDEPDADPTASKTNGSWFGGELVTQRVAPIDNLTGKGNGSYETFRIERELFLPANSYKLQDKCFLEKGLVMFYCKTGYRPYDLAVTAVLIITKHHDSSIEFCTDGEQKDWLDAMVICNNLLGYGMDFKLD